AGRAVRTGAGGRHRDGVPARGGRRRVGPHVLGRDASQLSPSGRPLRLALVNVAKESEFRLNGRRLWAATAWLVESVHRITMHKVESVNRTLRGAATTVCHRWLLLT